MLLQTFTTAYTDLHSTRPYVTAPSGRVPCADYYSIRGVCRPFYVLEYLSPNAVPSTLAIMKASGPACLLSKRGICSTCGVAKRFDESTVQDHSAGRIIASTSTPHRSPASSSLAVNGCKRNCDPSPTQRVHGGVDEGGPGPNAPTRVRQRAVYGERAPYHYIAERDHSRPPPVCRVSGPVTESRPRGRLLALSTRRTNRRGAPGCSFAGASSNAKRCRPHRARINKDRHTTDPMTSADNDSTNRAVATSDTLAPPSDRLSSCPCPFAILQPSSRRSFARHGPT